MLKGQVHGFSHLSWNNSQESKWMNEWINNLCKNGFQCFWLLFEKQTWNIVNVSFIFLSTQWKHYDMDGLWEIRTLSSDILQVKHSCKELLLVQKLHLNFSLSFFFMLEMKLSATSDPHWHTNYTNNYTINVIEK